MPKPKTTDDIYERVREYMRIVEKQWDREKNYLKEKSAKEKERAKLQLHHDSSVPRPCGDYIPCGFFLWAFNPKRTKARESILRITEDIDNLTNEYIRCKNNILFPKKEEKPTANVEDERSQSILQRFRKKLFN